jgi:catechol 2,3-dioxygenase-like lactoylglutathione lyase family enzyme
MVSKRGSIQHVEINVSDFERSRAFYQDFLEWLGYRRTVEGKDFAGWSNGEASIFVTYLERYKDSGFHRRRVGLNHIAFWARSKADVDNLHSEFLVPKSIKVLYGGPKEYPEYGKGYYAVYFEDPDRIKLEFVHRIGQGRVKDKQEKPRSKVTLESSP